MTINKINQQTDQFCNGCGVNGATDREYFKIGLKKIELHLCDHCKAELQAA